MESHKGEERNALGKLEFYVQKLKGWWFRDQRFSNV